ncbi:hypothetical protein [Actinomadura flavalba]|uniref:hypothetical protein n=1 Tax=Actinomadura flavalba TaxID=1120938 RepID=UPI000380364A|nr:hypothetical protein [Actinomadura flavalba]
MPLLPLPVVPVAREEFTPPPVAEVLAVYADRKVDRTTAARGAAKVRESLVSARDAAVRRRAEQKAARAPAKSA